MVPPAEVIKRQANEAFKAGDYQTATALYSHSMSLDVDNPLHVLNRSMSNLKLTNWKEAEIDATLALTLSKKNEPNLQKALFRRSRARKAQGDLAGARADLKGYVAHGGSQKVADTEALTDPLAVDVKPSPIPTPSTADQAGYKIKDTVFMGKGAFATRNFHRGDRILAEKPMISLPEPSDFKEGYQAILSAVERLSPKDLLRFLSLHNGYSAKGGNIFIEIYRTNVLPDGLCDDASRFNHSCLPNARYSFHGDSGRYRIFAFTDIAIGQEIRVSYLSSRNVYGSTRDERRVRILAKLNFTCLCDACSLEGVTLKASDDRRREMLVLWERMVKHDPRFHGQRVINDAVQAIRLLREEGYAADADDFATDAAALCDAL
ncbi:hypothetical protein DFH07DRAFT_838420 [Mycena maculata]|uniref:SET domain-containing protein n=1 Tax=Mycena maculata TaxID=230809 RepID=A0AAD7IDX3_9AGAR|nr:hypothetical protein DFH07DRAFT_838420 [Mycena maculata]